MNEHDLCTHLLPTPHRPETRNTRGYRAWARDYRPDLADFIRDVFDLDSTTERLRRIQAACEIVVPLPLAMCRFVICPGNDRDPGGEWNKWIKQSGNARSD